MTTATFQICRDKLVLARPARRILSVLAVLVLATGQPASAQDVSPEKKEAIGGPAFAEARAKECAILLRRQRVAFTVEKSVKGDGKCGAQRPLTVTAIRGISLQPAVTVRCAVARAMAFWVTRVVVPSAKVHLRATPTVIRTSSSYVCRRRRGDGSVIYSEHAFANAIDIAGFVLMPLAQPETDGKGGKKSKEKTAPAGTPPSLSVTIQDWRDSSDPARAFQAAIRGGACAFFTTVIGPMTNAAHADHLHLDLKARRGGYRLCE